jgi:hypothetical protein
VLLAVSTPCVEELRRRTSTIPIVFAIVTDPVGQGFVTSLSQPGGNVTGFTDFDAAMAGKWLWVSKKSGLSRPCAPIDRVLEVKPSSLITSADKRRSLSTWKIRDTAAEEVLAVVREQLGEETAARTK